MIPVFDTDPAPVLKIDMSSMAVRAWRGRPLVLEPTGCTFRTRIDMPVFTRTELEAAHAQSGALALHMKRYLENALKPPRGM